MYDDFEKDLKEELFLVHKYMKIPFREIYQMPVFERRIYRQIHNKVAQEEREAMKKH